MSETAGPLCHAGGNGRCSALPYSYRRPDSPDATDIQYELPHIFDSEMARLSVAFDQMRRDGAFPEADVDDIMCAMALMYHENNNWEGIEYITAMLSSWGYKSDAMTLGMWRNTNIVTAVLASLAPALSKGHGYNIVGECACDLINEGCQSVSALAIIVGGDTVDSLMDVLKQDGVDEAYLLNIIDTLENISNKSSKVRQQLLTPTNNKYIVGILQRGSSSKLTMKVCLFRKGMRELAVAEKGVDMLRELVQMYDECLKSGASPEAQVDAILDCVKTLWCLETADRKFMVEIMECLNQWATGDASGKILRGIWQNKKLVQHILGGLICIDPDEENELGVLVCTLIRMGCFSTDILQMMTDADVVECFMDVMKGGVITDKILFEEIIKVLMMMCDNDEVCEQICLKEGLNTLGMLTYAHDDEISAAVKYLKKCAGCSRYENTMNA